MSKEFFHFSTSSAEMGDMNFSLTTFNKTGKLMQIEYALARVQQGKMALGIKGSHAAICRYLTLTAKNGVVIATDKKASTVLIDSEEYQKIQSITPTTGKYTILFKFNRLSRICFCWHGS